MARASARTRPRSRGTPVLPAGGRAPHAGGVRARSSRCAWGACVAAVWLVAPEVVAADPAADPAQPRPAATPGEEGVAAARRLFAESVALREEGRFAEAAERLRAALSLRDTPGLRFHLAHCESRVGHLLLARAEFGRAQALLDRGAPGEDVRARIPDALAELAGRIPSIELTLPLQASELEVTLDGARLGRDALERPIEVDPGAHVFRVVARGHAAASQRVEVAEGERRTVLLSPGPPAGQRAAPTVPRAASGGGRVDPGNPRGGADFPWRTAVLAGEGLVAASGVAIAIGFAAVARGSADRSDGLRRRLSDVAPGFAVYSACAPEGTGPADLCARLAAEESERRRAETIAWAGAGVALAGGASLAATWFFWRPGASASSGASVAVSPTSVRVIGRF